MKRLCGHKSAAKPFIVAVHCLLVCTYFYRFASWCIPAPALSHALASTVLFPVYLDVPVILSAVSGHLSSVASHRKNVVKFSIVITLLIGRPASNLISAKSFPGNPMPLKNLLTSILWQLRKVRRKITQCTGDFSAYALKYFGVSKMTDGKLTYKTLLLVFLCCKQPHCSSCFMDACISSYARELSSKYAGIFFLRKESSIFTAPYFPSKQKTFFIRIQQTI